jgi:cytochrome c-type biogenesis protein
VGAGSIAFAFLAGVLSDLSPCVLPLAPIVLGAAASEHRLGPAALASGVAISFVGIGLFVATVGFSIGLDGDVFRSVTAILMIAVGAVLAVPQWQMRLAVSGGPVSDWLNHRMDDGRFRGLSGQFGIGLLLGGVWSPCVGPTLGAASLLAARAQSLGLVAVIMIAFGVGAAAPLFAIGLLSREALVRRRNQLISGGKHAKAALGLLLAVLGILILAGLDRRLETLLVAIYPQWLTDLTTKF